jgi:hypothetical protein
LTQLQHQLFLSVALATSRHLPSPPPCFPFADTYGQPALIVRGVWARQEQLVATNDYFAEIARKAPGFGEIFVDSQTIQFGWWMAARILWPLPGVLCTRLDFIRGLPIGRNRRFSIATIKPRPLHLGNVGVSGTLFEPNSLAPSW